MTQRSRFFDSTAGDRIYGSDAWAQVISGITGTGIVPDGNRLAVVESSPAAMSVRVGTGKAFILGYYFENYSDYEPLTIAAADSANPRIDRIVVRRSLASRACTLAVLTGTPGATPAAPALTETEAGTYEISLAQVLVPASSTSVVNARITDERAFAKSTPLADALNTVSGHQHDGSDSRVVPYASLSGKPTTFTVATHTHASASSGVGGTISYTDIASKPSTFAPSAHAASHGSGGSDAVTVPWGSVSGKPTTFAPASHALASHTGTLDDIGGWAQASQGGGAAGTKIWVGTSPPSGPSEGDVWIKG